MFEFWNGSENLGMSGFVLRAFITYIYIFLFIKILGQRSLNAINPIDFLFGVIIGDILGEPLSSGDIELSGPYAAAATIGVLHYGLSFLALKTTKFRRVIEDEPIILIEKGRILHQQLKKTKITVESLLMDMRINGTPSLHEVDYAVLESNGQISVIRKSQFQSVNTQDLNLPTPPATGYPTVLIMDGQVVEENLSKVGTLNWLENQINKKGFSKFEEVFLFTMDESGQTYSSRK
jgi:uncharacterized membrane protein YcaP (DUF421 family)